MGALWLRPRDRRYRLIAERDAVDKNHDGIPDVFQQ